MQCATWCLTTWLFLESPSFLGNHFFAFVNLFGRIATPIDWFALGNTYMKYLGTAGSKSELLLHCYAQEMQYTATQRKSKILHGTHKDSKQ